MFADLKEYQDLTRIYNESVNISEEERQLQRFIEEEDFTLEELEFCVENFEEICALEFNEDYLVESNLNEEDLHEILGGIFRGIGKALGRKAAVTIGKGGVGKVAKNVAKVTKGKSVAAIKKAGKVTKQNITGASSAIKKGGSTLLTKAGTKVKNIANKVGKSGLGQRLKGAGKNIIDTVKKNPAKALIPAAIVGSGVAGFVAGGKGKKEGSKSVAAPTNKLSDAELDAKIKAGIAASGMGDKGTAITQKGREQAAYNKGERAARKKLNDPTLNLTKSELEAKAAKEKEKAEAEAKSKQKEKPMSKIEFQNRKRFGDEHVENLKNKNVDFQKMKKGEMTKKEFIDKYPKSQTAKKYYNSPKAYRDYKKSLKKEDYSFAEAYTNMYKQENINEMGAAALIPKDSFKEKKPASPTKPSAPTRKPSKMGAASLIPDSSFSDTSVRRRSSARGVKEETVEEGIGGLIKGGLKAASKVTKLGQKAAVGLGGIGVGVGGGKMLDDARKEGKKGKKKPTRPNTKGPGYHTGHPIKMIDGKPTKMPPNMMPPSYYGGQDKKDAYQNKLDKLPNPKPKRSMKEEMDYLGYDAYDVVLEYLLQTEQVSSIEEANYVMTEMEGTTINEILNEMVPILGGIVKAGKIMGKAMSKVKDKVGKKGAIAAGSALGGAAAAIGSKIKKSGKAAGKAAKGMGGVGASAGAQAAKAVGKMGDE